MKGFIERFCHTALVSLVCMAAGMQPVHAAALNLSDVPLFVGKVSIPNVFFEIDDSGSMDWEILTAKHWHYCTYDSNAAGNSGSSDCGWLVDNGLHRSYTGSEFVYFEYLFNDADHAYSVGCSSGSSRRAYESCTTSTAIDADWRVRASAVNVVYYNPGIDYSGWNVAGTQMPDASFSAAKSDPQPGSAGYSVTRNLAGIVYEVWTDDKGYSGSQPRRGTNINVTSTANSEVDLWDSHRRFTVNASSILVEDITYTPTSTGLNKTVTTVATLTGGPHSELGGKTVAEVQQNIANWYQYARKRSYVTKGAVAAVVSAEAGLRYGLSVINSHSTLFQEVPGSGVTNFTSHNQTMLNSLFNLDWPSSSTPLRQGLERTGKYFDDDLSGKSDPIINECQQNFAVLFTDGYWNGSAPSGVTADKDGDGYSVTVADVAKHYYDKDLSTLSNSVSTTTFDTNNKQHMVTFGVSFGVEGQLVDTDGDGWPDPALTEASDWGDPTTGGDIPEKIDDLWHAAYNSRGGFIAASTPKEVVDGLKDALADIKSRGGSSAAAAASSTSVGSATSIYQAGFDINWTGSLISRAISDGSTPRTGCTTEAFGEVCAGNEWNAATVVTGQSYNTRNIFTYNPTANKGIPFRWPANHLSPNATNELTAAQVNSILTNADPKPAILSPAPSDQDYGEDIINYLRGDNSQTGQPTSATGTERGFRERRDAQGNINNLGAIINSAPRFVKEPLADYPDSLETSAYSTFASANASRTGMIYVGSSDGMLHGFRASDGKELMAYVPNAVYDNLPNLASQNYSHKYMVDGSPTVSDAFFGSAWHTVLVAGLGGGGKAVYALDVTNPNQFSESQANANKLVLWEYTDADLGYTYGRPDIVKLNDGNWAAVFGNGYNNTGTGHAVLYIVNLETGALIEKISTEAGSTSDPNGLSTVVPVDTDGDLIVDYIYGGDLLGNLWKFDLKGSNTGAWDVAYKSGSNKKPLFTAETASGIPQPITSRPSVDFHPESARGGYLIYFGTGKFLEKSDVNAVGEPTQTFYAIWDRDASASDPVSNNRTSGDYTELLKQEILIQPTVGVDLDGDGTDDTTVDLRINSDNAIDWNTHLGWYLDLTNPTSGAGNEGERQVTNSVLRDGRIIFTTLIPGDTCAGGGSSFLMELDGADGGRLDEPPFDVNNDGVFNEDDVYKLTTGGTVTIHNPSGIRTGQGILSEPKVLNCMGEECKYMSNSRGTLDKIGENADGIGRQSWRQLYH